MKVRKEVRELCLKMCNNKIGSKEWNEASEELIRKWKFTPYNLLALVGPHPTIECNNENMALIREVEK